MHKIIKISLFYSYYSYNILYINIFHSVGIHYFLKLYGIFTIKNLENLISNKPKTLLPLLNKILILYLNSCFLSNHKSEKSIIMYDIILSFLSPYLFPFPLLSMLHWSKLVDMPDERRSHEKQHHSLGGIGILLDLYFRLFYGLHILMFLETW